MIKAIIFDVGGVLIRTEDRSYRQTLEKQFGLAPGGSDELVFNSAMGQAAQRGELSDAELWTWIAGELGLAHDGIVRFRRSFWSGDVLDQELVDMIRSLKQRYQTAIISNATDALDRSLKEKYGIADAFDVIVCSAAEGIMKPDPSIFQIALGRLGLKPAETVFVDDFQHNVAAAQKLGMHAIQFHAEMDVKSKLATLGVTV